MQIEMTIKGLMVDPITNMPIIILRDSEGQKVLPMAPSGKSAVCRQRRLMGGERFNTPS